MYFASRMQAGRMLASQLIEKYRYEDCAVVALNDGGVVVGAQIAMQLHCVLMLLDSREIRLPREIESIGSIAQDGTFTYNSSLSQSEINDLVTENFSFIEQEKFNQLQELHKLVGAGGVIKKDLIRNHNVILVADGLKDSSSLAMAYQYLKPVSIQKLIVATPLASVPAVDYIHVMADDVACLSVIENYMDTGHYYDTQDVPDHGKVTDIIENIILNWK